MLRKFLVNMLMCFMFVFSFNVSVDAYEFRNEKNALSVNDMISEIYDAKEQYEELAGGKKEEEIIINDASSNSYWWPIGSADTIESNGKVFAKGDPETLIITSYFGYRKDPFGVATKFHSGMDISGGSGLGNVNIIAAKDGIVVYPTSEVSNNCPFSTSQSNCGGGYGNYVIIQHSDGNYTLYAHLHENSILVTAGESVVQGQVIGKMGSSGNSTGAHLHFEVREGQNAYSATVDPLNYISSDSPRSAYIGGEFINWLVSWEGHTPIIGDNYEVVNIGDGVRTVGSGVTLENNPERFAQHGIDIDNYPVGSQIPVSIVDQIKVEIVNEKHSSIEAFLASNSLSLKENQIDALVSQSYNIGNINGFVNAYNRYGNTNDLYDNWFFRATMPGTKFEAGLKRRRNAEWSMFHMGEYVYNS